MSERLLFPPTAAHGALADLEELREQVCQTVALAGALAMTGRAVDVAGLDRTIGHLCAKTLDLPPDQGRTVRPRLIELLTNLDTLGGALQAADPLNNRQKAASCPSRLKPS